MKITFPSKHIALSASVILVRPLPVTTSQVTKTPSPLDYQVLLLQRNPNLSFAGGFYAFPGGKIEK